MDLIAPPLLTQEEEDGGGGGGGGSWVLLDHTAYVCPYSVLNSTTAVGKMSNGTHIELSFCLGRPPQLSYLCAHFPGPVVGPTVGSVFGPPAGTPAVRCVRVAPVVICSVADLALVRVSIPGSPNVNDDRACDYFVYTARPFPGASSLDLLPRPPGAPCLFRDCDVAIVPCPGGSGYIIAALRITTGNRFDFSLQRYDSNNRRWTMTPLSVHQPERDKVLPIPDYATENIFHSTDKVILLGSTTVGWVDLWRGILSCDVLDKEPVLRDLPLPKPARRNRTTFCMGSASGKRDITVLAITGEVKIRYVEMEFRPEHSGSGSGSDSEDDFDVTYCSMATVWSIPVSSALWNDWHKDCTIDVADTIVQNPRHCEVLQALRLTTGPEDDAAVSLRRLRTAYPTLGLGMAGDLAIYFLSTVDYRKPEEWVIEVGVKDNKLHGIAKLDVRKNRSFNRCYCITHISKHLTCATGEAGILKYNPRGMRQRSHV